MNDFRENDFLLNSAYSVDDTDRLADTSNAKLESSTLNLNAAQTTAASDSSIHDNSACTVTELVFFFAQRANRPTF